MSCFTALSGATLLLLLTLESLTAQASTYYVAKSGSDGHSCARAQSPSTPKLTINAGIACLAGGDTLVIGGGTYTNECLHSQPGWGASPIPGGSSWRAPTTLRNAPGATVWLTTTQPCPADAEFGGVITFDNDRDYYVVIDGLNIDGTGVSRVGLSVTSRYTRFQNLTVKNIGRSCVTSFPTDAPPGTGASASHNEFLSLTLRHCGLVPDPEVGSHGFYIASWHNLIEHADISDVNCIGITLSREGGSVQHNIVRHSRISQVGCAGIVAYPNNTVSHTIITNSLAGINGSGARLLNNIVYGNKEFGILVDHGATEVKNTIALQNGGCDICAADGKQVPIQAANNVCSTRAGNLGCTEVMTAAQAFVNVNGGDLRLTKAAQQLGVGTVLERPGGPAGAPPALPPAPPVLPAPKNLRAVPVP